MIQQSLLLASLSKIQWQDLVCQRLQLIDKSIGLQNTQQLRMEPEISKHISVAKELSKKYPMMPFGKLLKYVQRADGNIQQIEEKINSKQQRLREKSRLTEEEVYILSKDFPQFSLPFILKIAKKCDTLDEIRDKLNRMKVRGRRQDTKFQQQDEQKQATETRTQAQNRKHKHRPKRYEGQKQHKQYKEKQDEEVDLSGILLEMRKLYPTVDEESIKKEMIKVCKRLQKVKKSNQMQKYPPQYEYNVKFICEATGYRKKQVEKAFQELSYNVDGTIQYFLSQQNSRIRTHMSLPEHVTHIYVDGNNLLYLNKEVRSITLQSGKSSGSLALCAVISSLNKGLKKNIVVVFDQQKQMKQFHHIKVESSRPKFNDTDDYFVSIGQKLSPEEKQRHLFVTSDNGLLQRLSNVKCENLMRSKTFMHLAEEAVPNIEEATKRA